MRGGRFKANSKHACHPVGGRDAFAHGRPGARRLTGACCDFNLSEKIAQVDRQLGVTNRPALVYLEQQINRRRRRRHRCVVVKKSPPEQQHSSFHFRLFNHPGKENSSQIRHTTAATSNSNSIEEHLWSLLVYVVTV
jgi:hypothetical protein